MKAYEIEATVMLSFNFEVDALNKSTAEIEAGKQLKEYIVKCKKEYDGYEIVYDSIEESEGH